MLFLLHGLHRLSQAIEDRAGHPERGDVPGWVLITVMTATIVALLFAIARDQLVGIFQDAITSVTSQV